MELEDDSPRERDIIAYTLWRVTQTEQNDAVVSFLFFVCIVNVLQR